MRQVCVLGLLCVVLALLCVGEVSAGYPPHEKVRLADVNVLTLTKGKLTTGRRSSPVPQLSCISGDCSYAPSTMMCRNLGGDGVDASWKCEAPNLPKGVELTEVSVMCEGFDYADDPYILRGSCGVEYGIEASRLAKDETVREHERVEHHKAAHQYPNHASHNDYAHSSSNYGYGAAAPKSSWWSWVPWTVLGWYTGSWWNSYTPQPQHNSWWWPFGNSHSHQQPQNSWWAPHANAQPHGYGYSTTKGYAPVESSSFLGNLVTLAAISIIGYVFYRTCIASNRSAIPSRRYGAPPPYSAPGSHPPADSYPSDSDPSYSKHSYSSSTSSAPGYAAPASSSGSGFWQGLAGGALASHLWHRMTAPAPQVVYQHAPAHRPGLFGGLFGSAAPAAAAGGWYSNAGYGPVPASGPAVRPAVSPVHAPSAAPTHTSTAYGGTKRR